ncbi:capsular biosynthesis protein [Burkholderia stabilis]|uniref:Capsular biosynthesis protein n=1 Tax=Burkholderia stabilis TaxID=95485 RepID=A0A4Q2ARX2_9BURK|nr:capsular biosynthesis protein [Burkholderia stabilis]RXV72939.1 capsular biosynthesis protein [Burkholderia stabilis]
MSRAFLVLQGTASPFFSRLSRALRGRGHATYRVNFCGGDVLYGGASAALDYRGEPAGLPDWYEQIVRSKDISDVIMFGDCRDIHRPMHDIAQASGLQVHVFEEGYIRPHWLTLEQHGVNGRSRLPRDPSWYLDRRSSTPPSEPGQPTGYNLYERAFHDISYRAANTLYAARFPHYRSHRPRNGLVEYSGLASRMLSKQRYASEAERVTRELLESKHPYYLFPLQLNSDAQIVAHSPFDGVLAAIDQVLASFARHARQDTHLVIKNHPLDTGLIDYRRHVLQRAAELGIGARLRFVDAGHLPTLLEHARGVVVVNSTVGLSALHHRRPLIALGAAIYDMPGLTWQGGLDAFWREAGAPDGVLYQAFLDYVMHYTQINGDFYTRTGMAMATEGALRRFEGAHG